MSGRYLSISLALFLMAVIAVEVETAGPLPGSPTEDGIHMILPDGEANRYWSRWRGPTGQGLAVGTDYPDTWSATQNVLWKVEVPGRGNSSPIVWADRIFLTTARDGGKHPSVLCYRRSDGKLLWESTLQAGEPGKVYWKNSHASGTPVTDGQMVYASFGNQGLAAVDFQGKVVWRHSLGTIQNYHGPAGSPVLYKDRIFLYEDQRQGALGSRIRQADRQDPVENRAQGQRRLGHAHRHPGRRPRRADRQQPGAGHGLRSRQRHGPLALWGQPGRGHPHSGGGSRAGFLRVGPGRADAGNPTGRIGRCHPDPPGLEAVQGGLLCPLTTALPRSVVPGERHGERGHLLPGCTPERFCGRDAWASPSPRDSPPRPWEWTARCSSPTMPAKPSCSRRETNSNCSG